MGQVFEVYFWVAAVWERGRWGEGGQRRNTGVSPLRRQSAPPSVEMTFGVGRVQVRDNVLYWVERRSEMTFCVGWSVGTTMTFLGWVEFRSEMMFGLTNQKGSIEASKGRWVISMVLIDRWAKLCRLG
jgi:hypothetical protein